VSATRCEVEDSLTVSAYTPGGAAP
jgi:hypothetical protein